ncbi:MAG: sigma-70 family RNA polymerase sigma factor [Lachnospiraceae bacterium]|nr:sigma-70 family RNA polymerase sigma factor [Lachnospiraceae bacterium]
MNFKEFTKYKEKAFISFCRTVIRREGINLFREFADHSKREVPFSSIPQSELWPQATVDKYNLYCQKFIVCGHIIAIYDCDLGDALAYLNHKLRNALLLFYFSGYNDSQIGQLLHISPSAVRYRRSKAIKTLKSILEENSYE